MKIIAEGRAQAGWSKEFKCTGYGNGNGGCEARLLVSEYDIYQTTSSAMGEVDCHLTFCCAQCGVETDLDGIRVPRWSGKQPSDAERKAIGLKNLQRLQTAEIN